MSIVIEYGDVRFVVLVAPAQGHGDAGSELVEDRDPALENVIALVLARERVGDARNDGVGVGKGARVVEVPIQVAGAELQGLLRA